MACLEASRALYARLGTEPTASRELSLPSFAIGAPLTQSLTYRASEAMCWAFLAHTQVNSGQVQPSLGSGRRALALAQESKNVWAQVVSTLCLTYGLLDAGVYEEALGLMHHTLALARTLPSMQIFLSFLTVFGSVYHALQQWDEARRTLAEAVAVAERLDLKRLYVPILSQLCMHAAAAGEWEAASQFALKAIALRQRAGAALIMLDFSRPYETEALLRWGEEGQARTALQGLGERLGNNRRFRLPYLRSRARLSAWEGQSEQAIGHLHEAAGLAADLGLPAEQWQIQATLARGYEAGGEPVQAHTAWAKAARIIAGLAQGIGDEARRSRFLAGRRFSRCCSRSRARRRRVRTTTRSKPSGEASAPAG
jgi:tetratricopeptide (TPR) repeat protein